MTFPDDHDCALPDLYEALRQNFGADAVPDMLAAIYADAEDDQVTPDPANLADALRETGADQDHIEALLLDEHGTKEIR